MITPNLLYFCCRNEMIHLNVDLVIIPESSQPFQDVPSSMRCLISTQKPFWTFNKPRKAESLYQGHNHGDCEEHPPGFIVCKREREQVAYENSDDEAES